MCVHVCVDLHHTLDLPIDGHLACFHALVNVNNSAGHYGCIHFFAILILSPSHTHPEVELLDYMVVVFLICEETS